MPFPQPLPHFWRIFFYTMLLGALGVAGNYFNVDLFFSVSIIFGSVFAFVALATLGLGPALAVAAAAGSYTWIIWGHPYAAIIFTIEILFVGLLRHKIKVYVYSDFLYWILLGVPLVILFYSTIMGLGDSSVFLIALKQMINGVFNALIGPLLVDLFLAWRQREGKTQQKISAKQLVASILMLTTILAGGVPIIFNNYRVQDLQEENLIKTMKTYANAVVEEIAIVRSYIDKSEVEAIYKAEEYARNRFQLDGLGISITYEEPSRRVQIGWVKQYGGIGDFAQVNGPLMVWKPSGDMPSLQRWENAEYFMNIPVAADLGISEVLVTHTAKPIIQILDTLRTQTLIALALLLLAALCVCYFLSELLINPIQRLATASRDVGKTMGVTRENRIFPRSPIREYDELATALQTSSDDVRKTVHQLTEMKETLELRVEKRTAELSRLSTVASQSLHGVIILNTEGLTEWVNDALTTLTGFSRDEFLNRRPRDILYHKDINQDASKRISEALANRQSFKEELLYFKKSGEEMWGEVAGNQMTDMHGVFSGFICVINDVTDHRMDRLNLVKARIDAERSNEAKSLFLSTMSHEIRTPLNGIMGMAELLASTDLDQTQKSHLKAVTNSCNILLAILNDVLDMSKIEAGAVELEETPFNLQELLTTTLTPFKELARSKSLGLNVGTLPELEGDILGDPVRLRQIIANLVSNAIKFTQTGHVDIDVETKESKEGSQIILRVTDTGNGISADRLDDIFDPFTQEDNTITRKFGGTGLGLSIVNKLIELMQGKISVKSEQNVGTEFTVTLPLIFAENAATTSQDPEVFIAHRTGISVLLAEDNLINVTIAKSFLEKLGCSVTVAENGRVAVEKALEISPELIFMDIHMPELDGVAATQEIKSDPRGKSIPIIGLTADAFKENKERFANAGMVDVLTKPFTEEQIQRMLGQYFPDTKTPVELVPANQSETIEALSNGDGTVTPFVGRAMPIGDDAQFDELKSILGEEAIRPMLDVAPVSFREDFQRLRQATDAAQNHIILEASHAIKGSAGALYALRLAEQAAYIQDNSHDLASVQSLMPEFEETLESSIQWLGKK
ncbi:PAS domain-containing hybrid sensor histidine kinase/response regulator [Sneathiella aquimaris]|uniref:PAS domain-containing hybrid sensor histidine kinase/response regulator n=1 Tax=Sneathiella aquimaris TaxID=2599305 RepID=UPI00146BC896|nr:PAS domain-containing hybrid sensor histidine kinase/response regulator [Sneathiella aquimaris]